MTWRLILAQCFVQSWGNWLAVVEKAKAQEQQLEAQSQLCAAGGTPSCGSCEEVQEALEAAQKVKSLESATVQGSSQWTDLMDALEYTSAPGCYDVAAREENEPSSEMSHEERRTLVSMALGKNVDDSYFFEDEKEDRRLWEGPRIAAGYPCQDKTMKYAWDPNLHIHSKRAIQSAMEEIREKSCVKFQEVPFDYSGGHYVQIIDTEEGCWAGVGSGHQRINLAKGCRSHGIAVHEILHVLGQKHEQSRPDRDHFLNIQYDNVVEEKMHNFQISSYGYTSRPYDYMSVMHYSRFAFSKNAVSQDLLVGWTLNQLSALGIDTGDATLQPRNGIYNGKIGQRVTMSDGDVDQLNDMYQCKKLAMSSEGSVGLGISLDLEAFNMEPNMESILSADWLRVGTGDETMPVACNAGFAVTSCSCFHPQGECRGALVTEVSGGTCVASPTRTETSNLRAKAICVKLAAPHYSGSRLSMEGSQVEQACSSNYVLTGCSCSARSGQRCYAYPKDSSTCRGVGIDGVVHVQAHCIRSLAILGSTVVTGSAGRESIASCTTDLVGCHCKGASCQGARPMGQMKNQCKALAIGDSTVEAVAVCATLADYGSTDLPTAEYLTGGQVGLEANQPIQSLYCESAGEWSSLTDPQGCGGLKVQTRTQMEYNCSDSGCQQVGLVPDQQQEVTLSVSNDGVASCPAGWLLINIACKEQCKSYQLKCAAPPADSPWYLSGGRSYSPWFNSHSGSAMGSCGQALAVGLECAKSTWQLSSSCKLVRLHCRRVALFGDDSKARFSAFDMTLYDPRWSRWISSAGVEENIMSFQIKDKRKDDFSNNDRLPIRRIQCKGDSCDELRAEMPTKLGTFGSYVNLRGIPTIWTTRYTDAEMVCPPGHYVANIRCHDSYCAKKELMCAIPGNSWLITGRYYSYCFTNKGDVDWAEWIRDKVYTRASSESRTCAGLEPSQMPDRQSCGEDGVLIGLRCYGSACDRLQLVCGGVDANLQSDGTMDDVAARRTELVALGLFDDMSTWPSRPSDGRTVSFRWNGKYTTNALEGAWMVDGAVRSSMAAVFGTAAWLVLMSMT